MGQQNAALFLPVLLVCCQAWSICLGAEASDAEQSSLARRILADAGVRGGLVVHVGCGDGRLTAALGANERHLVQGLDTDAANVEQARKRIHSLGLYGDVSVAQLESKRLPYADNLVNLLVVEDESLVGLEEVMRVLVPGGVLYAKRDGQWTKTVKPWPSEIDEWTHWLHGPDGNAVAQDTIVGPLRRLQWIAKPYWLRDHHTAPSATGFVSAGGRVFYILDEAPAGMEPNAPAKWVLVARDAFNGLPLWRRPMPEWGWKTWSADWKSRFTIPTHISRRLVAVGDRRSSAKGLQPQGLRQRPPSSLLPKQGNDAIHDDQLSGAGVHRLGWQASGPEPLGPRNVPLGCVSVQWDDLRDPAPVQLLYQLETQWFYRLNTRGRSVFFRGGRSPVRPWPGLR